VHKDCNAQLLTANYCCTPSTPSLAVCGAADWTSRLRPL